MRKFKTLINQATSLAVAAALATGTVLVPNQAYASGVIAGATEPTQIISWLANFQEWATNLAELQQHYQKFKEMVNVQNLMNQAIGPLGDLVRSGMAVQDATRELNGLKNEVQTVLGSFDQVRSLADGRYNDMLRFSANFGDRATVAQYWDFSKKMTQREHTLNGVLRDQEVGAMKRLEEAHKAVAKHASQISSSAGINESMGLLNSQMNTLVAAMVDVNKVAMVKSTRDTERDDADVARREAANKRQKEDDAKNAEAQRQHQAAIDTATSKYCAGNNPVCKK